MRFLGRWFWVIIALAFAVRLFAAVAAPYPGIADSTHYYNLGRNLAEGRGFVIDYIWQYHNAPIDVTHPTDYWMPLPAVYPAVMLSLFPGSLLAALLPSVLIGTGLVALTYAIAARMGMPERTRYFAMLIVACVPELILNSARTDTTMSYILYIGIAVLCFDKGLHERKRQWLFAAGVFGGLAHLSRQDGVILLIAMLVSVFAYARIVRISIPKVWFGLAVVGWVLVLSPWLLRNLQVLGVLLPSSASRTMFMTSFIDQFTYGRTLNLDHYLDWGIGNILRNWVTQSLANVLLMVRLQDIGLPIFSTVGFGLLFLNRDREKFRIFIIPIIMVVGLFLFYSFVTPFHTQGGSFKKSFMLMLPFLAVIGAWAITQVVTSPQVAGVVVGIVAVFMLMNSLSLLRTDFDLAGRFDASMRELGDVLAGLGDVNGDGEIIVMGQDPFALNYVGYRALMTPSDDRDTILEAAYRYQVDYIQLPSGRDALGELDDGHMTDPRFVWHNANPGFALLEVLPKP